MITINTTGGSEDLIVITNTDRGSTTMGHFGTIEFGRYAFGSFNADTSDNGRIIINNTRNEEIVIDNKGASS